MSRGFRQILGGMVTLHGVSVLLEAVPEPQCVFPHWLNGSKDTSYELTCILLKHLHVKGLTPRTSECKVLEAGTFQTYLGENETTRASSNNMARVPGWFSG